MKKITAGLASLSLSFYVMAALIVWLAVGIALARFPETEPLIEQMNQQLILDWLADAETRDWRILGWFLVFCLLNLVLSVNLLVCSWTYLRSRSEVHTRFKNRLLFIIHILVLLVLAGHLANMAVGYKYSDIRLVKGASYTLPSNAEIFLESVQYELPVKYLKMDGHELRRSLTRDRFDISRNYARVRLIREDSRPVAGKVHRLKPLKVDSTRITLNRFFLAGQSPEARLGVDLTIASNPFH